jgi:hypothetical protein
MKWNKVFYPFLLLSLSFALTQWLCYLAKCYDDTCVTWAAADDT